MCVSFLLPSDGWRGWMSRRDGEVRCAQPRAAHCRGHSPAQPRGFGSRIPPRLDMSQGMDGRRAGFLTKDDDGIAVPPSGPLHTQRERKEPDCRQAQGDPQICPLSSAFRCALPASPPGAAGTCSAKDRDARNSRRWISHPLGSTEQGDDAPQVPGMDSRVGGCAPQHPEGQTWRGSQGDPRAGCTLRSAAGAGVCLHLGAFFVSNGTCTI